MRLLSAVFVAHTKLGASTSWRGFVAHCAPSLAYSPHKANHRYVTKFTLYVCGLCHPHHASSATAKLSTHFWDLFSQRGAFSSLKFLSRDRRLACDIEVLHVRHDEEPCQCSQLREMNNGLTNYRSFRDETGHAHKYIKFVPENNDTN